MSQSVQGRQTKQDILHAALQLFALQGYHYTSTHDILQAAAVSRGAFYHHFRSKEELAVAVLAHARTAYDEQVVQPVRAAPPAARLREFLRRIVALNQSGRWNSCLLLARLGSEMADQEGRLAEQVTGLAAWLLDFCREILADAHAVGAVRPDVDPSVAAELLLSVLLGAVACRELGGADQLVALERVIDQLHILLVPTGES